jgi:hypothetical protein
MIPLSDWASVDFFQPNPTGLTVPGFSSAFDGIFLTPLTEDEQIISTPTSTLFSTTAKGQLPRIISQLIEPGGAEYYYQLDTGKLCLTRINEPPKTPSGPWNQTKQNFKDAVASWKGLTPNQKAVFNNDPEATRRRITGYTLYISRYLKGLL